MQASSTIRVKIDNTKITAQEVNPYSGKDGRMIPLAYFQGAGNWINGELLAMNSYYQKFNDAEKSLREFVIKKINLHHEDELSQEIYTVEQYGDLIRAHKIYDARLLDGNNIILV